MALLDVMLLLLSVKLCLLFNDNNMSTFIHAKCVLDVLVVFALLKPKPSDTAQTGSPHPAQPLFNRKGFQEDSCFCRENLFCCSFCFFVFTAVVSVCLMAADNVWPPISSWF